MGFTAESIYVSSKNVLAVMMVIGIVSRLPFKSAVHSTKYNSRIVLMVNCFFYKKQTNYPSMIRLILKDKFSKITIHTCL